MEGPTPTKLASKLDPKTLKTLNQDKTFAIGLAVDSDGDPTLVWSTSGDWINPALEKATAEIVAWRDLTREKVGARVVLSGAARRRRAADVGGSRRK